ncbi:MAG TPA: cbb3-type cytochrome c oxidase subunit I [Opitutaceae bacterium]|jgi:cytochrome c oxidase cbb3-type subunit 1
MTHASTSPADSAAPAADVTAVESAGRLPLLLLTGSAVAWLILSALLTLVGVLELVQPSFLSGCAFLSYGRVEAMAESAFIYGWVGNAGLAVVLWMLGRLSGEPLRAPNWMVGGASFWNFSLLCGLIGMGSGYATAVPFFQLPAFIVPIMLISYCAMAVPGVLAWIGRRRDLMFASQWYAVAALFLFPWIVAAAYVMLDKVPVQGVVQAVVGGWYAQSLWALWMAPMALAGAYYVVPRVTGRTLPAYDSALLGFWLLLVIGGFTAGRHLINGPVPAWVSSIAIVSTFLLIVHYVIVALNLRPSFGGGGTALKFIALGVFAYLIEGFVDAITSVRGVAVATQFTYFDLAQTELALYGGITLLLFGSIYFAVPRITGRPWPSAGLIRGHWALSVLGLIVSVGCLALAGLKQGADLNHASVAFASIFDDVHVWLVGATVGGMLLLLGNLLLALNLACSVKTMVCEELFSS